MDYISTRGEAPALGFRDALLAGLARDGGLYVPREWPAMTKREIKALRGKPYQDVAFEILKHFVGDEIPDEVERFLSAPLTEPAPKRVLATVLFTDIVGSTERATSLGDRRWREVLASHRADVRRELARYAGVELDTAGDGFFASFDGPARGIACAETIVRSAAQDGLEIRAGLHTGECEREGEKLAGIAVHIGARIAGLARPGEVLVSRTVKDLVAGSGIEFDDRGEHELKGVRGAWELYAVKTPT